MALPKLVITVVSALSLVYLTGCATGRAPSPDVDTESMTYEVFGMDCPGCHGGLEKNLRNVFGVADASANWKEKKVTIYLEKGRSADLAEIETAIKNSNFSAGRRLD